MTDDSEAVWSRREIESPCVKICVIHPEARICTGCFRRIEEIGLWSRLSPEDRRRIMAELPARESQLGGRKGGRAARRAARRAEAAARTANDP
ncbi:DUF1289 domain-containing protein [Histidinibacterium lentulum]|uniref:DUF1289 domain-containing protein n=1 Tax=Histidinibacterium lentulum TaxID=2480588 RepID=A0A3N2QY41_9RHOB|nr:DUF1289 domain-containing protein [Histidinibacterium lentulum]ROU00111.1 DUF1289 domain-containing protein [Histidinibacterium lentulum]